MTILIIQFSGADVVVARFEKRRAALVFLQGVRRPLPDPLSMTGLLEGFSPSEEGEKIILAISPSLIHARELEMPITDRRRLREILPLELAGEMAADADEMVFDAVPLGNGKVLAAWCRRKEVSLLLEMFAVQGLEPEIVTGSVLHWNLLLPSGTDADSAVTDGRALMIGSSDGPFLVRSLPDGNSERELSRSVAAYELSRDVKVRGRLRIGPADPESGDIPLNKEILDAFGGETEPARDLAGAYAVARAFLSGVLVNFRSGDLAYTAGQMKNIRRLRMTAILALTLVVLIFAEVGARYWMVRKDLESLETSISKIYREVFPNRKKAQDPVGEISSEIKRLAGGGLSPRLLPVVKKLAELKGDDVTGFFEVELEGTQVRLKGDARSAQAVNDFRTRAAKVLVTAEVAEIKYKNDGSVSFVFRGSSNKEAK